MRWDLFCRVIDNHGDAGVCWRLAADLAARGHVVRLWIDDATALAWMAPEGAPGVTVFDWAAAEAPGAQFDVGEVVIEAFGCHLPEGVVKAMAQRRPPPVWINLEYLSAEGYVERSHGLRSPQWTGPGTGLDKWFFYPGFTPATGGLLRENRLLETQAAFDARAWRQSRGWAARDGERSLVLFAYDNPALPELLADCREAPTLLLACPGPSQAQLLAIPTPPSVRVIALPWLSQPDFDRLLYSADLNFVRGEDSLVRAIWAGRPFVWQLYPQSDDAHAAKLAAFAERFIAVGRPEDPQAWRSAWQAWNGQAAWPAGAVTCLLSDPTPYRRWRAHLAAQDDLCSQLCAFVACRG